MCWKSVNLTKFLCSTFLFSFVNAIGIVRNTLIIKYNSVVILRHLSLKHCIDSNIYKGWLALTINRNSFSHWYHTKYLPFINRFSIRNYVHEYLAQMTNKNLLFDKFMSIYLESKVLNKWDLLDKMQTLFR